MKLTTNYSLKKPEGSDVVNIDDFNYNADIIDNAIQEIKNTSSTNKTNISSLQTKVDNGQNHKVTQDNGHVLRQDNIDLNTLTKTGFYYSASPTNSPMGIASSWYIDVKAMNSGTYVYQKAIRNSAGNDVLPKYERNMHNGAWTAWREL
jgi:hypothetical protein